MKPQSLRVMRQTMAKRLNATPHSAQVTSQINTRLQQLQKLQSRLVKRLNQGPAPQRGGGGVPQGGGDFDELDLLLANIMMNLEALEEFLQQQQPPAQQPPAQQPQAQQPQQPAPRHGRQVQQQLLLPRVSVQTVQQAQRQRGHRRHTSRPQAGGGGI